MPQIVFKILSTADQRDSIVDDIRHLVDLNSESLTADLKVATGTGGDASLEEVWQDYGFADAADTTPEPATVTLDVTRCEGSISALTARLSEVLVSRDKQPAEQLFQQVLDDPGTPRVPWHVDIRP
ncbi:hypothetical protein ACT3SZ_13570 [Corynebacterium sp. AOP40-9SA-29]|uniref:hypothetical protein n=1 Tax=Corynebacterium sp. AOP40-9SA-29 TaxID=3457677 RepID=UPI00403374FA